MSEPVNRNTNTSSTLTAFTLVLALLFSFSADALHFFSHGEHDHCTETGTVHFHQLDLECKIFDFHITPVLSFSDTENKIQLTLNFKTIFPSIEENLSNTIAFQIQLRGPPQGA